MSDFDTRANDLLDPTTFRSASETWIANRDAIMRDVNAMRSEAVLRMFSAIGRFTVGVLRVAAWPISSIWNGIAFARAIDALNALDDAALAKMGLERDDIANHVFGMIYGNGKPALAAIAGGKVAKAPAAVTPERRAA